MFCTKILTAFKWELVQAPIEWELLSPITRKIKGPSNQILVSSGLRVSDNYLVVLFIRWCFCFSIGRNQHLKFSRGVSKAKSSLCAFQFGLSHLQLTRQS